MKVKIEKIIDGKFDYDSIIVKINNEHTEIVFNKNKNLKQYEGKSVELVETNGIYDIKSTSSTSSVNISKNND